MQEIRYRLDEIEKSISSWKPQPLEIQESELLRLPDHLRTTYLTTLSLGECNATDVSGHTGRCRAIESNYLNQLARTGWLLKRRDSKSICFRPVSKEELKRNMRQEETKVVPETLTERPNERKNKKDTNKCQTINVKCLSADYDGTISPIKVARSESHVPLQTRVMLAQISKSLPVSIVTMKDLHFVVSKTPFAHAWSGIGGLETQVGKKVLRRECLESKLPFVSKALDYAKLQTATAGIEIEEKRDSLGRTLAFCVDWRRAKDQAKAKDEADRIIDYSKNLGLFVFKYEKQPFYDVYPIAPDKGRALQEMLNELSVKNGVMYLGDSQMDNSAFKNSNVSIGIVHDESQPNNLDCDYIVRFEDVPAFLQMLIARNYRFNSDFPMIKKNISPLRRGLNSREKERESI
jgi:trehalose-6-phosphatase